MGIMAADSVSDIKSHATQRGYHCGNTVLNVRSHTVDTHLTQKLLVLLATLYDTWQQIGSPVPCTHYSLQLWSYSSCRNYIFCAVVLK